MQMYLFHDASDATDPFRGINGDDDAHIVYHEYTHGLSNRLVTDADGFGAASTSPQAGAMGEAWSDWYAHGLPDRTRTSIERHGRGRRDRHGRVHRDGVRELHPLRADRLPARRAVARAAPAALDTGPRRLHATPTSAQPAIGGARGPLRRRDLGSDPVGPAHRRASAPPGRRRALVTDGMRLSPPEPSFLDMRNAILAADAADHGGANRNAIWTVFAAPRHGLLRLRRRRQRHHPGRPTSTRRRRPDTRPDRSPDG